MGKEIDKGVKVYKVLTPIKAQAIQVREQEVCWEKVEILYHYYVKLFGSKLINESNLLA